MQQSNGSTNTHADGFLRYVNAAVTPFHAVVESSKRLEQAGFVRISEKEQWTYLERGGKYYYIRNGSTIVAFAVGKEFDPSSNAGSGFVCIGSHTDSPNLKVKPSPHTTSEGVQQLGVQQYGGLLLYPMFDRAMALAGRLIVRNPASGLLEQRLVNTERAVLTIPSLAIHLNRSVNSEGIKPNVQTDMLPIHSLVSSSSSSKQQNASITDAHEGSHGSSASPVFQELARIANVSPDDIMDHELQLVDTQPAQRFGLNNELISSGRIDNLASVYQSVEALINTSTENSLVDEKNVRCIVAFDNEEVGSRSQHGAAGSVLSDFISRMSASFASGSPTGAFERACRMSYICSSDSSHVRRSRSHHVASVCHKDPVWAVLIDPTLWDISCGARSLQAAHPNYASKHDSLHKPHMNGGMVLKIHAEGAYASSGPTSAVFRQCAHEVSVPVQEFVSRQDMGCGSTIGPIVAQKLGIPTVDVGIAQLSMHSVRETAGAEDFDYAVRAFEKLFERAGSLIRNFE